MVTQKTGRNRGELLHHTIIKEDDNFVYYHADGVGPYRVRKEENDNPAPVPDRDFHVDFEKPREKGKPYIEAKTAAYTERVLTGAYKAVKGDPEPSAKTPGRKLRNAGLIIAGVAALGLSGYFFGGSEKTTRAASSHSENIDTERIWYIRGELAEGIVTRNQKKLDALKSENKEYVNDAMRLLLADGRMGNYYGLFGDDVISHLSLQDRVLLKLANDVVGRYDLIQRARADRAEKERIARLREEFHGYPADQLTPEQREQYRQTLNVRGENYVDPATAEARENERKRQAILGGARDAVGSAARAADDFRYNVQNNPQRTADELSRGARNAVDGQADAAGKAVEQGKQDLGKVWDDLTKKKN